MATQLQIVNDVLLRLREDPVATVAQTPYSKLIAKYVNDAKHDMEDIAHDWSQYYAGRSINITGDDTAVSHDFPLTNRKSWLVRSSRDDRIPLIYDGDGAGSNNQIYQVPLKEVSAARLEANGETTTSLDCFALGWSTSNDVWTLEIPHAVATGTSRTVTSFWYVPQEELAIDGSDDATEILLPKQPIELRATAYAVIERGEELAQPAGPQWQASVASIGAAIEMDMQVNRKSEELDVTNKEFI